MNITDIVTIVIQLIGALAAALLVPYIKEKVSAEKLAKIMRYIKIFVGAAEQLYAATDGDAKKQYVVKCLAEKGIICNSDDIDAAIEAEVLRLHRGLSDD